MTDDVRWADVSDSDESTDDEQLSQSPAFRTVNRPPPVPAKAPGFNRNIHGGNDRNQGGRQPNNGFNRRGGAIHHNSKRPDADWSAVHKSNFTTNRPTVSDVKSSLGQKRQRDNIPDTTVGFTVSGFDQHNFDEQAVRARLSNIPGDAEIKLNHALAQAWIKPVQKSQCFAIWDHRPDDLPFEPGNEMPNDFLRFARGHKIKPGPSSVSVSAPSVQPAPVAPRPVEVVKRPTPAVQNTSRVEAHPKKDEEWSRGTKLNTTPAPKAPQNECDEGVREEEFNDAIYSTQTNAQLNDKNDHNWKKKGSNKPYHNNRRGNERPRGGYSHRSTRPIGRKRNNSGISTENVATPVGPSATDKQPVLHNRFELLGDDQ